MEKKVRWGILGTANIAKKAFIPGLLKTSNSELYAVSGRKPEKISEFETLFSPAVTYDSYEKLLTDENVDAVYIPLPNSLHMPWAIEAMEAGKHVLCEKPLALNVSEVERMRSCAEDNRVYLMEAFAYVFNPLIKKIRHIVETGVIGELESINSSFVFNMMNREYDVRFEKRLGGGAMYDIGCYTVHLIRHIFRKEPVKIHAFSKKDGKWDVDLTTSGILKFDSGHIGRFHSSFCQNGLSYIELLGNEGSIYTKHPFNESGVISYQIKIRDNDWETITLNSPDNYMLEAEHFSDLILNGGEQYVSLSDSYNNIKLIEQILEISK